MIYSVVYVFGVQETFSTISGLVWEAVLYLNSKQPCLAFSERRDNLLRADVFASTSVTEVSGSPKLPLCGSLFEKRNMGLYCPVTRSDVKAAWVMGGGLCYPTEEGLQGRAVSLLLIAPNTHLHFVCEFVVCFLLPLL